MWFNTFLKYLTVVFITILFTCAHQLAWAQVNSGYQKPPQAMIDLLDSTKNHSVIFSNKAAFMAICEENLYPSITEVSQPFLKLAGLRINPKNYTNQKSIYFKNLKLKNVKSKIEFEFYEIPKNAKIKDISFSLDEKLIAFTVTLDHDIELWIGDLESKKAKKITNVSLNDVYGKVYQWAANGQSILAKCRVENVAKPIISQTPTEPNIQENINQKSPSKIYQDLLQTPTDELLFTHYLTVQIKMVYLNGEAINFGLSDLYRDFDFSPDGTLVMTKIIQKPYSYIVPVQNFSYRVEIKDRFGELTQKLADVPIADNLMTGFDAVIKGPREHGWRADKPQTFFWVEAQDGGDPSKKVSVKDIIFVKDAGTNGIIRKLANCYLRFIKVTWGDEQIAIITERWWKTRAERRVFIKPNSPTYRVNLWDRYYENTYDDPGVFVTTKNEFNKDVLLLNYSAAKRLTDPNNMQIFSVSQGSSSKGDRPFLLKFNVKTKLTDTLFRSKSPFYEYPVFFQNKNEVIITKESATETPNYFAVSLGKEKSEALTTFKNPYSQLNGVTKQLISYPRSDKLLLTSTLYLPKDYNTKQGKLPVLMWACPKEYKTEQAAAQVKGSPYQFIKIDWNSPIFWVTQGYAVMDKVDMPIVGESNDEPNDTFLEQLKQNAEAAINKIALMRIGDEKRIAIGGHAYGAFMAANLVAHTNLFAAAIAKSGVYNRTLTPFGFQFEERTLWNAPSLYQKMSPLNYAHQIKIPLLLIHGDDDDNAESFPIQSGRFYSALKSFGATTRLVFLPAEAHSYKAKESVLHMLWEMNNWLETYVKNKNN
jgi:dipeptidyl aminopeptidase/acylaminoacyl peptidase